MAFVKKGKIEEILKDADNYISKEGNSDKAMKLLEDTLDELNPSSEEYYAVLLKLSKLYRNHRSYNLAEDILKNSVNSAKKYHPDFYLAEIYRSLSFIKLQKKDITAAKEYSTKALSIMKYKKGRDAQESKANIYASLGNIYFANKEYDRALENYRKACKKTEGIDFIEREITVKNDMANVYIEQGEIKKAKDLLLSIIEKAKKHYDPAVPQVFLRLARVEYLENENDRAKAFVEQAIDFAQKRGWRRDIAEAREAMSRIYKKEGREKSRKEELKKAKKIYKEIGLDEKADVIQSYLNTK